MKTDSKTTNVIPIRTIFRWLHRSALKVKKIRSDMKRSTKYDSEAWGNIPNRVEDVIDALEDTEKLAKKWSKSLPFEKLEKDIRMIVDDLESIVTDEKDGDYLRLQIKEITSWMGSVAYYLHELEEAVLGLRDRGPGPRWIAAADKHGVRKREDVDVFPMGVIFGWLENFDEDVAELAAEAEAAGEDAEFVESIADVADFTKDAMGFRSKWRKRPEFDELSSGMRQAAKEFERIMERWDKGEAYEDELSYLRQTAEDIGYAVQHLGEVGMLTR